MADTRAGRRTRVMDLTRDLLAEALAARLSDEPRRCAQIAHGIVTSQEHAALLRELGQIALEAETIGVDVAADRILKKLSPLLKTLSLRINEGRKALYICALVEALREPDLEAIFAKRYMQVCDRINKIVEPALGGHEPAEDQADTLDTFYANIRRFVLRYRYDTYDLDTATDLIVAHTVWLLCMRGASNEVLSDMPALAMDVCRILEPPAPS